MPDKLTPEEQKLYQQALATGRREEGGKLTVCPPSTFTPDEKVIGTGWQNAAHLRKMAAKRKEESERRMRQYLLDTTIREGVKDWYLNTRDEISVVSRRLGVPGYIIREIKDRLVERGDLPNKRPITRPGGGRRNYA
jgi:hypothetical protein